LTVQEPAPSSIIRDAAASRELPSPALVVDLDTFLGNVEAAAAMFRGTGKRLRPHVKAHRTPGLALRQLGEFTHGVTCSTVGEAEAMVAAGIGDVVVASEFGSRPKCERLAGLAREARVAVAVDATEQIAALSTAARQAGTEIGLYVDLDVGLHRCGAPSVDAAHRLALTVMRAPSIRLDGIMGYEGRRRASEPDRLERIQVAYEMLGRLEDRLTRDGIPVGVVTGAGTSTLREAVGESPVSEIQAGTYAFMEPDLAGLGLPFEQAVRVSATVISRSRGQVVLDAGRTSIACDSGLPTVAATDGVVTRVFQEHTVVALAGGVRPAIGDRVDLWPGHIPLTFNLHDLVWVVRDGKVVEALPIVARGRSS